MDNQSKIPEKTDEKPAPKILEMGNLSAGTLEPEKLKPKKVVIKAFHVEAVGVKNLPIGVFTIKHPDKEETVKMSKMKHENKKTKKLEVDGFWIKLDKENKIQKESTLHDFMVHLGVADTLSFTDRECDTVEDEGYLVFKGY